MSSYQNNSLPAGEVIKVRYSTYTHYGVVSDRIGDDGLPMIIDNSAAKGTVTERTWTEAVAGRPVSISNIVPNFSAQEIIMCARSLIGQVSYSLVSFNCESFVRKVLGLKPTSKQVTVSVITVPTAMYMAHKASGGNKWLTGLAGLAALAVTTKVVAD